MIKVKLVPQNVYIDFISGASDTWISEIIKADRKIEIKAGVLNKRTVKEFTMTVHDKYDIIKGIVGIDNGILKVMTELGSYDHITTQSVYDPSRILPHFAFFIEPCMSSNNDTMADENYIGSKEALKKELLDLDVPNTIALDIMKGGNR